MLDSENTRFFADRENWSGGPIFELKLVFCGDFEEHNLDKKLLKTGKFDLWNSTAKNPRFKTMFRITPILSVPLCQSTYKSIRLNPHTVYTLGIYPNIFERVIGCMPDRIHDLENLDKLRDLIAGFTTITLAVKSTMNLNFATISDESQGYANPNIAGIAEGLYLEQELCESLHVTGEIFTHGLTLINRFIT